MRNFFLGPLDDLVSCLERIVSARRAARVIALIIGSLVMTWFIYVPVHELLHVVGCVITGGTVQELQIAPQYGGGVLARIFPFVVSGGDYAGRLSGFDWKDSDLIYLATDFTPYLLSIVIGVPLIRVCAKRLRPILFGTAIVIGFAPIYNLPGDYHEMGSIIVTRAVVFAAGEEASACLTLRSDDVFKLVGEVFSPADGSRVDRSLGTAGALAVVSMSLVLALLLALATYALGVLFSRGVWDRRRKGVRMGFSIV